MISGKYTLEFRAPAPIASARQHAEYLAEIDRMMRRDRLSHDEERYLDLLTNLVQAYEEEHYPIPDASPVDVLRTLMEANNLKQKDLASIFGAESTVSEVLHGTRQLNLSHIERLSDRFNLSPEAFFRRPTKHTRERTVEE